MLSFAFSERLSCVTRSVTTEPAGVVTPLAPWTDWFTVAVKVSPPWLVFVQILVPEARLISVPAPIVPTPPPPVLPALEPELRVTVLPVAVFVVVGVVFVVDVRPLLLDEV